MDRYRERLKAVLVVDVAFVYERGLDEDADAAAMPALAELGGALDPADEDGSEPCAPVVEAALHRAISRIESDGSVPSDQRQEGFRLLLGIGTYRGGGIMARRDDAAPKFGSPTGKA
jgi:hypothetical protein